MIELEYSLIIEATDEPDYFGFYSPEFLLVNPNPKIIIQNEEKLENNRAVA